MRRRPAENHRVRRREGNDDEWRGGYTRVYSNFIRYFHRSYTCLYLFSEGLSEENSTYQGTQPTERKTTSREQIIINWRIGFVVG